MKTLMIVLLLTLSCATAVKQDAQYAKISAIEKKLDSVLKENLRTETCFAVFCGKIYPIKNTTELECAVILTTFSQILREHKCHSEGQSL